MVDVAIEAGCRGRVDACRVSPPTQGDTAISHGVEEGRSVTLSAGGRCSTNALRVVTGTAREASIGLQMELGRQDSLHHEAARVTPLRVLHMAALAIPALPVHVPAAPPVDLDERTSDDGRVRGVRRYCLTGHRESE